MMKKLIALLLVLAMVSVLFTGCKAEKEEIQSEVAQTTLEVTTQEPTTVDPEQERLNRIKEYQKVNKSLFELNNKIIENITDEKNATPADFYISITESEKFLPELEKKFDALIAICSTEEMAEIKEALKETKNAIPDNIDNDDAQTVYDKLGEYIAYLEKIEDLTLLEKDFAQSLTEK